MFINAIGQEEIEPKGSSFRNVTEAKLCVYLLEWLINDKKVPTEAIGVISPYTYQIKSITSLLNSSDKRALSQVTVNSVERFQGSEREVILITATRTSNLGFMEDYLRINTSITRAKTLLVVIGNEKALLASQMWSRFIQYCKDHDSYQTWEDKN